MLVTIIHGAAKVVERKQPRWNQQPTSTSLYNNMLFANALYQQHFACMVYGFLHQQHDKEFVSIRYSVDVYILQTMQLKIITFSCCHIRSKEMRGRSHKLFSLKE